MDESQELEELRRLDYLESLSSSDSEPEPQGNPDADYGMLGNIGQGALFNIGRGAAGLIQAGEETLGTGTHFGEETVDMADQLLGELRGLYEPDSYKRKIFDVGSTVVPAAASMILAPGTIPVLATLGAQTFGDKYGDLRNRGADVGSSLLGATESTALNTAINAVGVPRAFAGTSFPRKVLELEAINAIANPVQTYGEALIDKQATGEPVTNEEIYRRLKEGWITGAATAPIYAGAGWLNNRAVGKQSAKERARSVDDFAQKFSQMHDEQQALLAPEIQQLLEAKIKEALPAPEGVVYGDDFTARDTTIAERMGLGQKALPPGEGGPQRLLPGADYIIGDDFTARDVSPEQQLMSEAFRNVDPAQGDYVTEADLPILNAPKKGEDLILPDFEVPEVKGVQLETSSARTPEEQIVAESIRNEIQQSQRPPLFDANGEPIVQKLGSGEIVQPFTKQGTIRQSLSPEEKEVADYIVRPKVKITQSPEQQAAEFPDVKAQAQKVADSNSRAAEEARGQKILSRQSKIKRKGKYLSDRGSWSWKPTSSQEVFTPEGIDAISKEMPKINERDFSPGERKLKGIVDVPFFGRDKYAAVKNFNQFFMDPETTAKHDPAHRIAVNAALNETRNVHKVAEAVTEFFHDYGQLSKQDQDRAVAMLRGIAKSTREGKPVNVTYENLIKAGATPEVAKAAVGIRQGFDTALKTAEEAAILRKSMEIRNAAEIASDPKAKQALLVSLPKEINTIRKTFAEIKQENYMPESRFGEYFTETTLPDGTPYFALHESKRAMEKDVFKLSKLGVKEINKGLLGLADSSIPNLPPDLAFKFSGLDPESRNNLQGFAKHFEKSKHVAGYSEDFDRTAADYITSLARWSAKQIAAPEYQKSFQHLEERLKSQGIDTKDSELYRSLQRYVDYQKNPPPEYQKLRGFLAQFYLGMNTKSFLSQMTQTLTTTMPNLYKHVGFMRAPKVMGRAYDLAIEHILNPERFATKHPELAAHIKTALTDGSISEQVYRQMQDKAIGGKLDRYLGGKKLSDVTMWAFNKGEQFNRLSTLIAGLDVAQRKGMAGDNALNFAEQFVRDTQFDYSRATRPEFARGRKALLSTFRLFPYKWLKLLKSNFHEENGWKSAAGMIGHMVALAGVRGLPLAGIIISALQTAGQDPIKKGREVLGSGWVGDTALNGLPMSTLGVDMKGSIGLGELAPDVEKGALAAGGRFLMGVAADPLQRWFGKAPWFHSIGNDWRAIESTLPEAARYVMRGIRVNREGLRNPQGAPLTTGGVPLDENNVTLLETLLYSVGLPPARFSKAYEEEHTKEVQMEKDRFNDAINLKIARAKYNLDREAEQELRQSARERGITINKGQVTKYLNGMRGKEGKIPRKSKLTVRGISEIYR